MSIIDLTATERTVVFECLKAAAHGPFFPDWEFQTLFGLARLTMAEIASRSGELDDTDSDVHLAINNALNNLIGYPIDEEARWHEYVSVPREEVARIFAKWRGATPPNYFGGLD